MDSSNPSREKNKMGVYLGVIGMLFLVLVFTVITERANSSFNTNATSTASGTKEQVLEPAPEVSAPLVLDTVLYDKKMLGLATYASTTSTTTARLWPVKTVYPKAGAILPFSRIVAYYGNLYSKGMGVLGEYPEDVMLEKLKAEVKKWEKADPETPVIPALHYIDVTAQESVGKDGMYRLRMPDHQIDEVLRMAKKINAIVFLDIQVGKSTMQQELPLLDTYLKMPNVHLGIDPEFSMKTGKRPGTVIGTMDATDVNYTANYLAKLVRDNHLPPKILIVHRFTEDMVTNYKAIKPLPEVQIVMAMDGWGPPEKKIGTYKQVIYPEPVQFTGFKLFYKNDLRAPSTRLLTPSDILKLNPKPVYIQYQ
ncbi:MAG: hypothetical protein WCT49_03045 [Candidatus Paceibacterota bacterium]|jgi:hypothetical protein|nr:hypothetical protein [Candidatus Paceibacterota bacterium]